LRILKNNSGIVIWFVAITFFSCNTINPYYYKTEVDWNDRKVNESNEKTQSVFLIGDAGDHGCKPVLDLLHTKLMETGDNGTVLFLGDNIYYNGLPDKEDETRQDAERKINALINSVRDYEGNIVFIPGNHDWHRGHKDGLLYVKRQADYIRDTLKRENVFLPENGCPGPVEVPIGDDLVLIILDTQWWLHRQKERTNSSDCHISHEIEFIYHLEDALRRNKDKNILVAGHHPLFTNGYHGGRFPLKEHIFPLSPINKNLLIPLPVIGSLYPLYRKYMGNIQDVPHPRYKLLKKTLLTAFQKYDNLIYAAGHEHSLQYFRNEKQHYLVSGAGSKTTYTAKGHKAAFAHSHKGFMKLDYYENGEVWLEVWEPNGQAQGELTWKKKLKDADRKKEAATTHEHPDMDYSDSIINVIPGEIFKAKRIKRFLLGNQYRDIWLTPVDVPVLDLKHQAGGLRPLKKGGGMQTKSLRLKGADGKQYVIRSVQKYPEKAVPKLLRKTFAADIVKDQISAAHPYGAFIVPKLAEAVGVYHTNPKLVYVPHDHLLGEYLDEFGDMLALFEQRPAGNESDMANFGNTERIVGTPEMLELMLKDNHHRVDERAMIRARLFDILIGDWDRHEDQWRWATFKNKKETIYRPIPRDRDQAFFKFKGLLPFLGNRKWALRKFQNFNHSIRDVIGLGYNSRYVDRSFLTSLSLEDWLSIADSIKYSLTDEAIESAFRQTPDTIYQNSKKEIIPKLITRRQNLPEIAKEYYLILAKYVDVLGSDKDELFKIKRMNKDETKVTVYRLGKKSKKGKKIYQRVFKTKETKEIRIYGLGGEDIFEVTGQVQKGILIRIIGGKEKDRITDNSQVFGSRKMTLVYDEEKNKKKKRNKLKLGTEARDLTSKKKSINDYNRKAFKYNFLGPQLYFGYNVDDGLFLGGGVLIKRHGFRKIPFKNKQKIIGNFSAATSAFNIKYEGQFTSVVGKWDVVPKLHVFTPHYVSNYFGLGNETVKTQADLDFNRLRKNQVTGGIMLRKKGKNNSLFAFGPLYEYIQPEQTSNRFVSDISSQLLPTDFTSTHFIGSKIMYEINNTDNNSMPTRGLRLSTGIDARTDASSLDNGFFRLHMKFSYYLSFNLLFPTTLAMRIGGASNIGNFEFFQANNIGSDETVRGFRNQRFAGRSSIYHNTELRIKLFNFRSRLFPGKFGVLGFLDYGRVWMDKEISNKLHYGYGGGLWISPLGEIAITTTYAISEEENLFKLGFGFFF